MSVEPVVVMQAALLPVCATLSVLNQDGSYAMSPWLTRQETFKLEGFPNEDLDIKAAALHALSLHPTAPHTPVKPGEQQRMSQQVQQAGQQSESQVVQQSERQHVPQDLIKKESSVAMPLEVQGVSGKVWHDVLVAAAVRLVRSEDREARQHAMYWLARLVLNLTDEGGRDLVQAGAVLASLQLLQRETDPVQTRFKAMQVCLRLNQRGLLPASLLQEANIHQHLVNMYTDPGQAHQLCCNVAGVHSFAACTPCD